jgi:hypothetical protein
MQATSAEREEALEVERMRQLVAFEVRARVCVRMRTQTQTLAQTHTDTCTFRIAIPAALAAVVQLDNLCCRLCFAGSAAHVPVPATRPPDPTPSTPLHAHAVSTANEVGTHTHTHTLTHYLPCTQPVFVSVSPLFTRRLSCLCVYHTAVGC